MDGSPRSISVLQAAAKKSSGGEKSAELLGDRKVALHPSSVLFATQPKLAALVAQRAAKLRAASFLVFHGRIKTSQVFLTDASVISALPLLLFGSGSLTTAAAAPPAGDEDECSGGGGGDEALLTLDNWLRFETPSAEAALISGLRQRVADMVQVTIS